MGERMESNELSKIREESASVTNGSSLLMLMSQLPSAGPTSAQEPTINSFCATAVGSWLFGTLVEKRNGSQAKGYGVEEKQPQWSAGQEQRQGNARHAHQQAEGTEDHHAFARPAIHQCPGGEAQEDVGK